MRNLNDVFVLDGKNQNSWHLDVAVEGLIDGDSSPVYDHLISLLHEEISIISNDTELPKRLFKFTGLPVIDDGTKPVINDIYEGALSFTKPKVFNDPMDPILREWLNIKGKESKTKLDKRLFKFLKNSLDNLRICCLSRQGDSIQLNPLMWAHYADKHKGICIEYVITQDMLDAYNDKNQVLKICDVRYRKHKVMNDYITLDNALLAKGDCWKNEKETRLIYYEKSDIADIRQSSNYRSLNGFRIKSIYMGYRIKENDKCAIIKAIQGKSIALYQMSFDNTDLTKMVAKRI